MSMGIINVLPKNVAELIAAGEVIERPSSVIKELVENCIDAHSTSITVEIQNGGTTFMRVTDNGVGIHPDDVRNAFLRHATSKIVVQDDLDAINTLGFRGEALASICAVSKVEILTRHIDEEFGVQYLIEGSEEVSYETIGCPKGTTIIVRDIFYNVPARMKFLKRNISEGNAVSVLLDRIALSHPEVSFTFIRDGKQVMKTQGDGKLENAVYQVFGKDFFEALMPVSYKMNGISVEGFVTKPVSSLKANRSMQMFYINGRYVHSKTAMAALEMAYKGSIMVGKYPSCVLMISMNCSMLDVNVHPAKLEVRFTDENRIYDAVYHAVKSAVMQYDTRTAQEVRTEMPRYTSPSLLAPPTDKATQLGFSYGKPKAERKNDTDEIVAALEKRRLSIKESQDLKEAASKGEEMYVSFIDEHKDDTPAPSEIRSENIDIEKLFKKEDENDKDDEQQALEEEEALVLDLKPKQKPEPEQEKHAGSVSNEEVTVVDEDKRETAIRYIGEIFSTYIIVEYGEDRIMIIDKHAAHERLLYEKLKKREEGFTSQLLLEPVSLTFEKQETEVLLENKDVLMEAGFEIEAFGDRTILIRSVPVIMETVDIKESFAEIADYIYRHKKFVLSEKLEWIYANTACRAAIKGGNKSHPEELIDLVIELENNPEIRYCPHGRPVYFFRTKYEIEKMFGRLG